MVGDKDNVILNDMDESIGYYADLVALLKWSVAGALEENDFENAETLCENLVELSELADYNGLIILSENNGMGFTARKYTEK